MWRVTSTNVLKRAQDDRGATAVMVGLMLVVLLGIGAFVLDIGNQMWEARMQQNSADAAALAVAQDCAQGNCGMYQDTAQDYASDNTPRGSTSIVDEDGGSLTHTDGEVTVRAETEDEDGLSTWLAGLIETDYIRAQRDATAAWGTFGGGSVLALGVSVCEFEGYLDDQGLDPDELPAEGTYDENSKNNDDAGMRTTIRVQGDSGTSGDEADCQLPSGGAVTDGGVDGEDKIPGGFRWLKPEDDSACSITTSVDEDGEWAEYLNGAAGDCSLASLLHTTVVIPVFDAARTTNSDEDCPAGQGDRCVRIVEFVGFYLDGYRTPGDASDDDSAQYCNDIDGNSCIKGYFTKATTHGDPNEGGLGVVTTVYLTE